MGYPQVTRDMMNTTWFVSGCNRGIGLEIVRQLLQEPTNIVFASCRSPSTARELGELVTSPGTLYIIEMDTADEGSIKAGTEDVLRLLNGAGLDYLVNNAGIHPGNDRAFGFQPTDLVQAIRTNVIGPALITWYLLPAIDRSNKKVIANMSSGCASIARNLGPRSMSYSISKAALNMLTYKQAQDHPDLVSVALDPGWVKTDMGGEGGLLEPHESVASILGLLQGLTRESAGKFFLYTGEEIPR